MIHTKIPCKIILPALLLAVVNPIQAAPLGTIFSYQGALHVGGAQTSGSYDMTFALFNDPLVGAQIGSTWTNLNVSVSNGLFTTTVDFGAGISTARPIGWRLASVPMAAARPSLTFLPASR